MHREDFLDNVNFLRFQLLIDFDLLRGLFVPVLFVPVLFELIPLCVELVFPVGTLEPAIVESGSPIHQNPYRCR